MARESHKLLSWRIARHGRKLHFRFRHFPLPWRGFASRRRDGVFAGEFLVCQPPPECGAGDFDKAVSIVTLALVIAERLLIKIAEQMEGLDTDVGSFETALQQRPEILDSVCVNASVNIGLGMIHELMNIIRIESSIRREFIGKHLRACFDVRPHFCLQRVAPAVRHMLDAHLAGFAVQQAHDQFFARAASAGDLRLFIFVHEAGESADESLVGFDWPFRTEFLKTAALHCLTNAMEHEPSGRLSDAERAPYFIAADAIFAVDDLPHGDHPLIERERTILEDRADLDRELATVVLLAALPQSPRGQEPHFLAAAGRALDTVGPAQFAEQGKRAVTVREILDRFHQGSGPCDSVVHDPNLAEGRR